MQLIHQALNEHVTVAALSPQHGINDNLIFWWIRKWQTRGTVSRLSPRENAPALVPVIISSATSSADTAITRSDTLCFIKTPGGDVTLHHPTPELLSAVLRECCGGRS